MKNNKNITPGRISISVPPLPNKARIDALADFARQRLSSQPVETQSRKSPDAILQLPPGLNPVTRFIDHRDARPTSLRKFQRTIVRTRNLLVRAGFPPEFAETPVESFPWHCVDVNIARAFAQLLDSLYPNTRSRHNLLGILRALLRECAKVDLISGTERDRLLDCLPLKGEYRRGAGRELTDDEIVKLLQKGMQTNKRLDRRDRAIIAVFLSTGLRISEVAEIDVADLNLDPNVRNAFIKRTKPGRSMTVWLSESTVTILIDWLAVRGEHPGALFDSYLFPGRQLTTGGIAEMLTRRGELAHLSRSFSSHDFRRTFATRALRQNVDLFILKKLLGHQNIQTTLCYDRRTELEDRAVVDVLDLPGLYLRELNGGR